MDRRARILAIDDDALLIRSVRRILRDHHVSTAAGVAEALDLLAIDSDFDLILCDLSLPDGSGADLTAQVALRWPGLEQKVVFVTGGPRTESDRAFLDDPDTRWVRKPFTMAQLRDLAARALHGRPEPTEPPPV
jgi:CheY-like chemotaxis protein